MQHPNSSRKKEARLYLLDIATTSHGLRTLLVFIQLVTVSLTNRHPSQRHMVRTTHLEKCALRLGPRLSWPALVVQDAHFPKDRARLTDDSDLRASTGQQQRTGLKVHVLGTS